MKPYYTEKGITIYHGDCREVLPTLEGVQLILTDPPYQFQARGGGFYGDWESRDGLADHSPRQYLNELEDLDCTTFEPKEILPLFKAPAIVVCCNKALIVPYLTWAIKKKLLYDVHVLTKNNPIPAKSNHFLHDMEYIVLMREKGSTFNGDQPFDMYRKHFTATTGITAGPPWHPAEKPVSLMTKYIEILAPPFGLVVDPFMGSGTTLRAAKQTGRPAVGIELEEKYCEAAVKRLSQSVMVFE